MQRPCQRLRVAEGFPLTDFLCRCLAGYYLRFDLYVNCIQAPNSVAMLENRNQLYGSHTAQICAILARPVVPLARVMSGLDLARTQQSCHIWS